MRTSYIYMERLTFYLFMQPIIISKCITLMISRGKDIPTPKESSNAYTFVLAFS